MELQIMQPQVPAISWNYEQIKAEITEKVMDYTAVVYTADTIKEAKEDRARLNALAKTIDDERKRIKKVYEQPLKNFESQAKEVTGIIKNASDRIDRQVKEYEESKKAEKRQQIEQLFPTLGFQPFVTLDMIFDQKWLNATVSMSKIEEQMRTRMCQIGNDIMTINCLPEFTFEAMENYKQTLDLNQAIAEGSRLAEIARKKAEYEAQKAAQAEREAEIAQKLQEEQERRCIQEVRPVQPTEQPQNAAPVDESVPEWVSFRCLLTVADAQALGEFFNGRNIVFEQI